MRIVEITGSDRRMDIKDKERILDTPVNYYPSTCSDCNFPNIDLTPRPYFIIKSRAFTPNEIQLADQGNLLVQDRVRKIFELIIPNECEFHPTFFENTTEQTQWHLAVPKNRIASGSLVDSVPRCPACGQPEESHPGSQYFWRIDEIFQHNEHVLKSINWGTLGLKWWETWIHRDVFMSLRLINLLKQVKVKGVLQTRKTTMLDQEEKTWITEQLSVIKANSLNTVPREIPTKEDMLWFKNHLQGLSFDKKRLEILKKMESIQRITLPNSVKEYFSKTNNSSIEGPKVDDEVIFLDLEEWDFQSFDNKIGFAYEKHGDQFYLEVTKGRKEFKILRYNHEYEDFEDYANNFIDFLRQVEQ